MSSIQFQNILDPKFPNISKCGWMLRSLKLKLIIIFNLYSATDINPIAIETTRESGRVNGVTNIHVVMTSLVDDLKKNLQYQVDLLVTNPPFEPSPLEDVGKQGSVCAWSAGPYGRVIIDRILEELPELMSDHGLALMCCVKENDVDDIRQRMEKKRLYSAVVIERDGTTSSNYNRIYHQYVLAFSKTNYWLE